MHIPIAVSFARSGGTLVNQLLGVHPDCLILSEVNPAASVVPVATQASDWLNLIELAEVDWFQQLSYSQQIAFLDERAKSKGKMLIIRDWVTSNYLMGVAEASVPSGVLEQDIYLARAGYTLQPLVVTRKASYVYHSIRRNFNQFKNLSEEDFLSSYLTYAHAVSSFPKVSLEVLQSAPHETLKCILHRLGLSTDYIDLQVNTFADFHRCTGNNTLRIPSATGSLRNIAAVASACSVDNASCINEAAFAEADRLLGYAV